MSKKRRRTKRATKARRRTRKTRDKVFMITRTMGGNPRQALSCPHISQTEMLIYLRAHELLPPEMQRGQYGALPRPEVLETAIATLDRGVADPAKALEAIVILGHSPCDRAIEALERYITAAGRLAGVASAALAEVIDIVDICRRPQGALVS